MATIQYVVNAVDAASATFERIAGSADNVLHKLDEIGHKTATARVGLEGDKQATLTIDKLDLKMAKLAKSVATGKIGVEGQARALLDIRKLELEMDKLGAKRTKIHIDTSALSKLSAFQPSALGTAVALSPALIPLTAQIAAGMGAVAVSFGAAAAGAIGFGLVAKSVLTAASSDAGKLETIQTAHAKKLAALQAQLAADTTKKQRQATQTQIAALQKSTAIQTAILENGWTGAYKHVVTSLATIQDRWEGISRSIAIPALVPWLDAVAKGLQFIRPLLKPVADVFQFWGITLNTYFRDPAHAARIKELAAAFGSFAAQQLYRIGQFIVDIGKGVFNLGRDLAASGANFSAFGPWLTGIGAGFLTWSKSAQARADVRRFMKFIHDNGPVVSGILSDLKTILPGIFAGATTVGVLELQALGHFLNVVAGLPPGWQKPLTEAAGAMLLLSKIGVVSVGIKLTGLGLGAIGGAAGASGGVSALLAGAGAAMAAGMVLQIRIDLKSGLKGILQDIPTWFNLGSLGFIAKSAQGLANTIVEAFRKPIMRGMDLARHDIAHTWDLVRHDASGAFDKIRHDTISKWDAQWHSVAARFDTARHTTAAQFDAFRHNAASTWDAMRHNAATAWDTIWRNTVTRTRNGIGDVVGWFRSLPGRVVGALFGLGHRLAAFAAAAMNEMLNGIRRVGGTILGWFGRFVGKIVGFFARLLHHSPTGDFYHMGRNMMEGLAMGLKDHAHLVANAAKAAAVAAAGNIAGGPGGGAPAANAALARRLFPRWGSGAEWGAWNYLAMRESGWNQFARNPSSGAYGIPQALPASKLPFAGQAAGGSNPTAQIRWMAAYISGRYGDPIRAAQHEAAFNWYGSGFHGWFDRPTMIGVGERGRERVDITPGRGGPAQVTYNVTINVPPGANAAAVGRSYVHAIKEYERSSGAGWRR